MKYAIFDLSQEYCGPAMVLGNGAAFCELGGSPARFVLPKSKLSARSFAGSEFGVGTRFRKKRAALGDIINLKRFRKKKSRNEADRQAATNRAVFGRTRADRERDEREQQQLRDVVDQHRIEDENR